MSKSGWELFDEAFDWEPITWKSASTAVLAFLLVMVTILLLHHIWRDYKDPCRKEKVTLKDAPPTNDGVIVCIRKKVE